MLLIMMLLNKFKMERRIKLYYKKLNRCDYMSNTKDI